uniref:Uncharacterized protein n=1 Tax=Avena sativa TaxID=4498 RepID=A0ACD5VXD0_AVESA
MHVVMLPWLAFGHILPFTEFAKRVARQGHRVTFLSTPNNTRRLIDIPPALTGLIRVLDIPLPRVDRLPEHAETTIDLPSDALRPYLRRAYDAAFQDELFQLLQESTRPDWVIVDYASYWAPAAAARHGVPCAFLSLFSAAALSFFGGPDALLGLGQHAKTEPAHFTVVPAYVPFPTTVAYRGYEARELFEPGMVPDDSGVSEAYRYAKTIQGCELVGIRSSAEFEPEWLRLLGELYEKPVVPVGFFPPRPQLQDVAGHEATIRWLDRQAPSSVVYTAFGSEVKLTSAQLQRIALGLETSGLPFIWAFRPPTEAITARGDGLPEGFEERLAGRGVVCRGWVPQVRFLAHASVGGFLTHAGWNSVAEGLAQGVRLVLLPLVFDQGLNARNLVDKKIGVEVARDEQDGSFAPDDIAAALRKAMVEDEGEEFGAKVKELAKVFGDDEVNDQSVLEFLRHLSEYIRKNEQ